MSESNSPWIVDTTAETFVQDVIERSHELPVVVDFWASWCGPCRALGPVLEKVTNDFAGQFVLVKANTDELPEAATQFGVRGIPAVFAVVAGEVVDSFTGALPEAQVVSWISRLLVTGLLLEAQQLEKSDLSAAEAKYREAADKLGENVTEPRIGLARVVLQQGKRDEAKQIIDRLAERGFLEEEAERIRAQLDLSADGAVDLDQLQQAAESDPNDLDAQLQWARGLATSGEHQAALEKCLAIVAQQKTGPGDEARELMIEIFRVLPDDSPLTSEYRRKLSMALY